METIPTPQGTLLKTSAEFLAGFTDEDYDKWLATKPPGYVLSAEFTGRGALDEIGTRKNAIYAAMKRVGKMPAGKLEDDLTNLENPFFDGKGGYLSDTPADRETVLARARKTLDHWEAWLPTYLQSTERLAKHTADMRAGKIPDPVAAKYNPHQEETMETPSVTPAKPLRVISAASFAGKTAPEREELVHGLIPAKIIGGLYGDGAVGKSLLAMMLGTAVASGTMWLNRFVQKGPVVYVCCEDDEDEVHRRLENICREMRVDIKALVDFHIVPLADEDSVLAAADGRSSVLTATPLFNQLVELTGDVKPRLLIGDTLNDIFAGSEIDRMQAKQFIKLMRGLVIPHGGTGLILAHPSVDGMRSGSGTSGSTGWNNSFRWRGYLDKVLDESGREIDITRRVLKTKKLNYGPQGGEIELQYYNGCYRTFESGPMVDPMYKQHRADRVFLDLLRKGTAQNNHVSTQTNSPLYAPKIFKVGADKQGVKFAELKDAMGRLLDTGKIENAPYGARSRNQFRLYAAP
jgi:AAA domain-containing protein